jgi:hypothetical protein
MFCTRAKEEGAAFPDKGKRVMAILQLCIAFSLILGYASTPFMKELFERQSKKLLYHTVMGENSSHHAAERFERLPTAQKHQIIAHYNALSLKDNSGFWHKVERSFHLLLVELPPFEKLWLLLAVAIPLMLLLRVEGVNDVVWLLPCVAALYGWNHQQQEFPANHRGASTLFPSEKVLVEEHLKEPLSGDISAQYGQLRRGWELYLIRTWAHKEPAKEELEYKRQIEEGEYAFNLARLTEQMAAEKEAPNTSQDKTHSGVLLGYVAWNLLFAWVASRSDGASSRQRKCPFA